MSCLSAYSISSNPTTSLSPPKTIRNGVLLNSFVACKSTSRGSSFNGLFFRRHSLGVKRNSAFTSIRPFSPVMEWQDCTARLDVDVPVSVAYDCFNDREAFPNWMPFISSVKVLEDKPELSRWSLKYTAFGRDIEFSWLARNMQPTLNQKIHWRSLEGLPNRGAVRFYPKGPSACTLELTVSYEVPQILAPVAAALQPFTQGLLLQGLERFAKFAKSYKVDSGIA